MKRKKTFDCFTVIAACASRLLNATCVAWLAEGKEIPLFVQFARSELFPLVKTGNNETGKSEFSYRLVGMWNVCVLLFKFLDVV